ncbi:hypothetical protein CHCC20341_3963 [Bacillus licheniformis]|nr:hypothetical protein CHCC20341_3963 [Bacillus licheniformis]
MGVLGHVKKRGRLEKPRTTKRFIYLGSFNFSDIEFCLNTL